jgi:hypothetical protein
VSSEPNAKVDTPLANELARIWDEAAGAGVFRALAPAVFVLFAGPIVYYSYRNLVGSALYTDVTLLQYCGWCLLHGERPYVDWVTTDGPANYFIQAAIQLFAGTSDSAYRKADLIVHACGFGVIGAMLAPRLPRFRVLVRVAWAFAASAIWISYILSNDQMATCQREAYYAVLGGLGIAAIYASPHYVRKNAAIAIAFGVTVTTFLCLAKHTNIIYWCSAVGMVMLLPSDPERDLLWRTKIAAIATGSMIFAALAYLAIRGSLGGFFFWYFQFDIGVYRFFERQGAGQVLHDRADQFAVAIVVVASAVGAVATGLLPRRCLPIALAPLGFALAAVLQRKGWPYHFISVYGSAHLLYVVALSAVWEPNAAGRWSDGRKLALVALLGFIGFQEGLRLGQGRWLWRKDRIEEMGRFGTPAWEAGGFLETHTRPEDRIFYWGDDPNILLRAERRVATPHITTWTATVLREVSMDEDHDPPTPEQMGHIAAVQQMLQGDLCARALRSHAPAMVFSDGNHISNDAVGDFAGFCPDIVPLLREEYQEPVRFAQIRIFLRK